VKKVTILGMGYVGIPLAIICAEKGYSVMGIDKNKQILEKLRNGELHIKDKQLEQEFKQVHNKIKYQDNITEESDIFIIAVPTPVDDKHMPILGYVEAACEEVSKFLKQGNIVILESTIHPGTTEEIAQPILEKSGLKAGKDFFLGHCPERVDPGNQKWTVRNIHRVVGAVSKEGAKKIGDFYRTIVDGQILELNSVKAAEAVKIMENTFRDVNIAYMNELAQFFDIIGIDIMEVVKGASIKPFGYMPFYPGCGVGGHCIPVDPYYLIEKAKQSGFDHKFLSHAREVNNSMPEYTVKLFQDILNNMEKSVSNAKVGVLGLAFKGNVDDTRGSPALKIVESLKKKNADVHVFDPHVKHIKSDANEIEHLLQEVDYLILAADHKEFKNIDHNKFKEYGIKLIIDGKNCLEKEKIENLGIIYKGIGR